MQHEQKNRSGCELNKLHADSPFIASSFQASATGGSGGMAIPITLTGIYLHDATKQKTAEHNHAAQQPVSPPLRL